MVKPNLKRDDLLYPELSYKIMGVLFEVHNKMGYGFLQRYYQKAIAAEFRKNGINFTEQTKVELIIDGEVLTSGVVDFIVEEKIIIELKRCGFTL